MKIFVNSAKEDWVSDRYRNEWIKNNKNICSHNYFGDKIIWLISPWTWKKIPKRILSSRTVLCTIHHIDEDKFLSNERQDFYDRDLFVDKYHVISQKTFDQLKNLTDKPITLIPFWVNPDIWSFVPDKNRLRQELGFDSDQYLIGSFQRDTEGSDLKSPKLSKGPDRLVEIYKNLNNTKKKLVVILAGRRRQYIINELKKNKIEFKFFEDADFLKLNNLYNILDLYIVASRYEGGPAAIMESAITKTPIISTNVGIASEVLHPSSIFDMNNFHNATPDTEYAFNNVKKYTIPQHFEEYHKLFGTIS